MKNNKFAKFSLLVLSLALMLGAAFAMTASADDEAVQPEIISQNVAYQGNFALMYAVDATGIEGSVTLNVYDTYPTSDATVPVWTGTDTEAEYVEGNLNATVYEFRTSGIAAADICKQFYIQAVVDGTGAKSEIIRYSLAEYLYERLATVPVYDEATETYNPSADQIKLYETVLAFADQAQLVVGGVSASAERVLNYRFVTVEGGKLDTYFTTGVYPIGTALDLTADEGGVGTTWTVTPYEKDEEGTISAATASNKTTVEVTDVNRLHVKAGASIIIAYTDGYSDLDSFAAGASMPTGFTRAGYSAGNIVAEFENYTGRGTVLNISALKSASSTYLQIAPSFTEKTYDADTSKSYEISFDVKLNTSGNASDYIALRLLATVSSATKTKDIKLVQYETNGTIREKLLIGDTEVDVNPSEWFHIRIRVYKDDPSNIYIYVNCAEDEYTNNYVVIANNSNVTDFSEHNNLRILGGGTTSTDAEGNTVYDGLYLDNIFVGFTTAENPHTATEE